MKVYVLHHVAECDCYVSRVRGVYSTQESAEAHITEVEVCSHEHGYGPGVHIGPAHYQTKKAENCIETVRHDGSCCDVDERYVQ